MQYRELELEPAELMIDIEDDVPWTSGMHDALLTSIPAAPVDPLDTRLIRVLKALDR